MNLKTYSIIEKGLRYAFQYGVMTQKTYLKYESKAAEIHSNEHVLAEEARERTRITKARHEANRNGES